MDGNNHLFVANFGSDVVGEYNATTGATNDSNFISGLPGPIGIVFVVPEPSSLLLVVAAAAAAAGLRRKLLPLADLIEVAQRDGQTDR